MLQKTLLNEYSIVSHFLTVCSFFAKFQQVLIAPWKLHTSGWVVQCEYWQRCWNWLMLRSLFVTTKGESNMLSSPLYLKINNHQWIDFCSYSKEFQNSSSSNMCNICDKILVQRHWLVAFRNFSEKSGCQADIN